MGVGVEMVGCLVRGELRAVGRGGWLALHARSSAWMTRGSGSASPVRAWWRHPIVRYTSYRRRAELDRGDANVRFAISMAFCYSKCDIAVGVSRAEKTPADVCT